MIDISNSSTYFENKMNAVDGKKTLHDCHQAVVRE